jgi:homoserine kinase
LSHMEQVTVRVPASTSNLGPGFDCLGVALGISNSISVQRGSQRSIPPIIDGVGRQFFKRSGAKPFAFRCSVTDRVPRARGLGSSATLRLGLLHGLNQLAGNPLTRLALFHLCAELEGHPDNAAPASFGGFNVVRGPDVQRFDVSACLRFVLLIPDLKISTDEARRILPARVPRTGAVESSANACSITAAFAAKSYARLCGAFVDHLHQPFRMKLVPFLDPVIAAAQEAGALGAFLSGSGSTIAAVTLRSPEAVARAMLAAAKVKAETVITVADNRGARVSAVGKSKFDIRV